MEKIALIEFGNSHDEVLYPQYRFLKEQGYLPKLVVSEALKDRLFSYPEEVLHFIPAQAKLKDLRQLHRWLQEEGIHKVVINTASGKTVRKFVWQKPFARIEYFGVLHHLRKLEKSFTQGLIGLKLKRYYLLAEYLANAAQALKPNLQFSHFYASFLPRGVAHKIEKKAGEKWIIIPGQVEFKRRDYLSLLQSLTDLNPALNLKFVLLGKSMHAHGNGAELKQEIAGRNLSNYFILWDQFVPNEEFYGYLEKADFVLPLIHPDHPGGSLYQKQISGAWNMAIAYRVPLLMEQFMQDKEEFIDAAHYYKLSEMNQLWPQLESMVNKPLYQAEKWSLSHQAKAYVKFLEK